MIDQYVLVPEGGWPLWMERQIEDSDFVLMVCTETYFRRVMDKEEPGKGLGVRWEGRPIYKAEMRNTKFIPVLFEEDDSSPLSRLSTDTKTSIAASLRPRGWISAIE
jgi:hypothetical protein